MCQIGRFKMHGGHMIGTIYHSNMESVAVRVAKFVICYGNKQLRVTVSCSICKYIIHSI